MASENTLCLEARVWVNSADGPALIGERVRQKNGILKMVWHVDPKTILGVMWVEIVGGTDSKLSVS